MPKDSKGGFHMNTQRAMAADKASPAPAPMDDPMSQGPNIMDDPDAMQCIQLLQSKGYTGDQVMEAMEQAGGGDMGGDYPSTSDNGDHEYR